MSSGYNIIKLPKSPKDKVFYTDSGKSRFVEYRCVDVKQTTKIAKQLTKFLENGKPILLCNMPAKIKGYNDDITYQSIFLNTYVGYGNVENSREGYVIIQNYQAGYISIKFTVSDIVITFFQPSTN